MAFCVVVRCVSVLIFFSQRIYVSSNSFNGNTIQMDSFDSSYSSLSSSKSSESIPWYERADASWDDMDPTTSFALYGSIYDDYFHDRITGMTR